MTVQLLVVKCLADFASSINRPQEPQGLEDKQVPTQTPFPNCLKGSPRTPKDYYGYNLIETIPNPV